MNKACLFLIFYFFYIAMAHPVQTVEVYTYDVLPPFAYENDQGQLTGVYIEIVKTAVSRMPDYALTLKVAPWARVKQLAKNGEAFAILPPYFHAHDWLTDTAPKRPYIWPYSLPLYTQKDVVICNEEVMKQPRNHYPEDFEGLSFVIWRGDGRVGEAFEQMTEDKKIELLLVDSIEEKLKVLLYGRYQCTVTAKLPFDWYMAKFMKTREFQSIKKKAMLKQIAIISNNEGYLGYSDINSEKQFPYKKDFTIKFDIEIFKMKQRGEIKKIVERFVKSTN